MEEQKRLFIAIILSIVILLGWNTLFVDKTPVNTQPESTQQQEEISKSGQAALKSISRLQSRITFSNKDHRQACRLKDLGQLL